jgi:hypothetical protein
LRVAFAWNWQQKRDNLLLSLLSNTAKYNSKKTASIIVTATRKAVDEVFLVILLLKMLQQGWNEDNGMDRKFYMVIS